VPTPLIQQLSSQRGGGAVHRNISTLAKDGLIAKVKNARYDGYRLTYGGLDYLAMNTHRKSDALYSLGNQIGVGKESDIYVCASQSDRQLVLKLHRLGRISFRTVKANRDYLRGRNAGSWMYLSTLAAQKEYAFMKVLHREGFPVPEPVAWSRHTIVMEFIDAFPMRMVDSVPDPGKLYAELMAMIVQLASRGLIHGDYNEFNILLKESTTDGTPVDDDTPPENIIMTPILIDFPQTLSTDHANAEYYFDRDVECIKRYFGRKFKYSSDEPGPFFADAIKTIVPEKRLDIEVEATGFSRKMAKQLAKYVEATGGDADETQTVADGDDFEQEDFTAEDGPVDEFEDGVEALADEDGSIPQDPQVDDPKLAEELGSLTVEDDPVMKIPDASPSNFEMMPLELSHDPDVVAQKVKSKKKAAGWAI
jgi:RIO kinase 2